MQYCSPPCGVFKRGVALHTDSTDSISFLVTSHFHFSDIIGRRRLFGLAPVALNWHTLRVCADVTSIKMRVDTSGAMLHDFNFVYIPYHSLVIQVWHWRGGDKETLL